MTLTAFWKGTQLKRKLPPLVPPAEERAAWKAVPEDAREELLSRAEACAAQPYPMRLATDFLAFSRTGDRQADEQPYFFRRRKLCLSALAFCLGQISFLDDVINGVWCVCEESSWRISAHLVNPIPGAPDPAKAPLPDPEDPYIDLFAAQTGMILTLVRGMLGRSLDQAVPGLTARMEREVRRRLLIPFLQDDDSWWMGFRRTDLNNWTPWIVSSIMICALGAAQPDGMLEPILERCCDMLDRWLAVVPEDGGCDEGAGYWNMAGGALLDCLELLEEATLGPMPLWEDPKIRNILSFPLKAEIGGGYFLNFADCDARPFLSGERIQQAGEKLGDPALTALGIRLRGSLLAELDDVPHLHRLLHRLFHPSGDLPKAAPLGDVWLPDLQVRVVRRDGWLLGCKGGHNGESHNHNDVGSFLLFLDGEPEIVDAGNMVYTAKTFSPERYTLWNTRSAYHNLPLIGEKEQAAGAEYRAREVCSLPDGLLLDLAGAYDSEAGAVSVRRVFQLTADGLTLTDEIRTKAPQSVTWVFLFRNRPRVSGSALETERLRLTGEFDPPADPMARCRIEEIPVTDPRMARNWPGSLWRVLIPAPEAEACRAVWRFSRRDSQEQL